MSTHKHIHRHMYKSVQMHGRTQWAYRSRRPLLLLWFFLMFLWTSVCIVLWSNHSIMTGLSNAFFKSILVKAKTDIAMHSCLLFRSSDETDFKPSNKKMNDWTSQTLLNCLNTVNRWSNNQCSYNDYTVTVLFVYISKTDKWNKIAVQPIPLTHGRNTKLYLALFTR